MKRALIIVGSLIGLVMGLGTPAMAVIVEPFTLRYDKAIYGDFLTIGNAVMRCPAAPPASAADCAAAQAGTSGSNNNLFVMGPDNAVPLPGAFDSSSGQVTIPAGASVVYARMFWGGHNGFNLNLGSLKQQCEVGAAAIHSPGSPLTTPIMLRVAGGPTSSIAPQVTHEDPATQGGPHFYTAEAEVTSAFAGMTGGAATRVDVGNVWAAEATGCTAGWSLTLVWAFPSINPAAPVKRHVYLWGGHVRQGSGDPPTTITVDGFVRAPGNEVTRVSLTAYEGDRGTYGDKFAVNGTNIVEPSASAPSTGNNFFISFSDGALSPNNLNNLSVDAKDFDLPLGTIPAGATSAALTFSTNGDTYVPQQLALSVPVPELRVSKVASTTSAKPGDTITYTITARNISTVPFPNAMVSDDLSAVIDDAKYNGDAAATVGAKPVYTAPDLTWTGDLDPMQTVTITYSVTVQDPPGGDQRLVNSVLALESNCEASLTGPECATTIPIHLPPAPGPLLPITGSGLWSVGLGLVLAGGVLRLVVRR